MEFLESYNRNSESESSNTNDEDRMRNFFNSCDADGDGYLDWDDLIYMCKKLNLEDSASEIRQEFGMSHDTLISFSDFLHCRARVMAAVPEVGDCEEHADGSGAHIIDYHVGSWTTISSDSLGMPSCQLDSADCDSGARDLSPEPVSLISLIRSHDGDTAPDIGHMTKADILELAERIHLAAVTSMKGEITELRNDMQRVRRQRDLLERQLTKSECGTFLTGTEELAVRHEERITELHSIIAELRKKLSLHQFNIIREEDECEEIEAEQMNCSQHNGSNHDNTTECRSTCVDADAEISVDLSQVVAKMENASANWLAWRSCLLNDVLALQDKPACCFAEHMSSEMKRVIEGDESTCRYLCSSYQRTSSSSQPTVQYSGSTEVLTDCNAVMARQQGEITLLKSQLSALSCECKILNMKVSELEQLLEQDVVLCPPLTPPSSQPQRKIVRPQRDGSGDTVPVAKLAERAPSNKPSNCMASAMASASDLQPALTNRCLTEEDVMTMCQLEAERLRSRMDHLAAQNNTLRVALAESKDNADRLSLRAGRCESNVTALSLALAYSDRCLDACHALTLLLDSKIGILLSDKREGDSLVCEPEHIPRDVEREMTGTADHQGEMTNSGDYQREMTSPVDYQSEATSPVHYQGEVTSPVDYRREATSSVNYQRGATSSVDHARTQRLSAIDFACCVIGDYGGDLPCEAAAGSLQSMREDVSMTTCFEKSEVVEKVVRDFITQLRAQQAAVKSTVTELSSPLEDGGVSTGVDRTTSDCQVDMENVVLVQELMALKEEHAQLKAAHFLLENQSHDQILSLAAEKHAQEALLSTLRHMQSDLQYYRSGQAAVCGESRRDELLDTPTSSYSRHASVEQDSAAVTREAALEARLYELVNALQGMSRCSDARIKLHAELADNLKRANSALVASFDKTKRRYHSQVKDLECQLGSVKERYKAEVSALQRQLSVHQRKLSMEPCETSL